MNKKAVILVAGMGTRLRPLTDTNHKCLTEINGTPILDNCLKNLNDMEFTEVVLVIGYLGKKIREHVGDKYGSMIIKYAENMNYAETNTSASLLIGLNAINTYDEIYIIEGDVLYDKAILKMLVEDDKKNATILEPYNNALSGSFVGIGQDGFVYEWKHKSVQNEDYHIEDKYKTVNIHKFSRDFVESYLIPVLKKSVENNKGKVPLEYVMDEIVDSDSSLIFGKVLKGQKWFEIDDQKDLKIAEKLFSSSTEQ